MIQSTPVGETPRATVRIAVISDTHNHCPPQLPCLIAGADEIWHLGDVCRPDLPDEFSHLGPPLRIVRGNCDGPFWPLTLRREIAGARCHLVHIPPAPQVIPRGFCDILLHGHTHIPRDEIINDIRWLNPGSVSQPRGDNPPSFAWLTLAPGKPVQWDVVCLAL